MIFAANAAAECLAPPPPSEPPAFVDPSSAPVTGSVIGPTRHDALGRVVAPVMVNGQGPFRFMVDTGANHSAVSADLAQRLGLTATGTGEVHSIEGVAPAPLTNIRDIRFGPITLSNGVTPILQNPAVLAGEAGILGVDGMEDRRLRMDFEHHCIEILPAKNSYALHDWVSLRGTLRFGHLVVLRGRVRDININIIVDTGSDGTLGNVALRDALRRVAITREDIASGRAYTAGRPIVFDQAVVIPEIGIGDLRVNQVTAFIGDFHIFSLWGLQDEPTLLVGMDVLSQARQIAIDYRRAIVYFRVRRAS